MRTASAPDSSAPWAMLRRAITDKTALRVRYRGHERTVCPHALGWKNGRPKVLAYQTAGTTSHGPLPDDPRQRWRSLFVDEIEHAAVTDDPWATADNYSPDCNCIDHLEIAVPPYGTVPPIP